MVEERRKYKRYAITVSVSYTGQETESGKAQSKNISTRGICISSRQPMHVGHHVHITFSLATQTILAKGRVVWSEKVLHHLFENGIEFTFISNDHLKVIEKYSKTEEE